MTPETLEQLAEKHAKHFVEEHPERLDYYFFEERMKDAYREAYLAGAHAIAEKYRALEDAAERVLSSEVVKQAPFAGYSEALADLREALRKLRGES